MFDFFKKMIEKGKEAEAAARAAGDGPGPAEGAPMRDPAAMPGCPPSEGPLPVPDDIIPEPAAPSVPPEEARRLVERGEAILLDVREERERELAMIEGAVAISTGELLERHGELDRDKEIIPFCHRGLRGEWAAEQLIRLEYPRVRCLAGGIDAWAERIDPSVPRY